MKGTQISAQQVQGTILGAVVAESSVSRTLVQGYLGPIVADLIAITPGGRITQVWAKAPEKARFEIPPGMERVASVSLSIKLPSTIGERSLNLSGPTVASYLADLAAETKGTRPTREVTDQLSMISDDFLSKVLEALATTKGLDYSG